VLHLESLIAYDVDFPEEDDGPIARTQVDEAIKALSSRLDLLLSTIPVGQIIRDGAIVVIAGEPNVGKSSLFNALLGEKRAIVTAVPGTTRDAIEAVMDAGEWPIRLIDTAGLRASSDIVEKLGIETSERHINLAHLVVVCGDTDESLERASAAVSQLTKAPVLEIRTKSDLSTEIGNQQAIGVSAATGENLGRLQTEIARVLRVTYGEIDPELPVLTRARQIDAITRARTEVSEFAQAWESESLPIPIAAVHLRAAAVALEDVIGAVSTEDVLDRLFSSFCVGK
jgi:tRNA modification GTPase